MAVYIRSAMNNSGSNTVIVEFSKHSTLQHASIRKELSFGICTREIKIHQFLVKNCVFYSY